jgi:hypothetical protein
VPQTNPPTPSLAPFVLLDTCLQQPPAAQAMAITIPVTINPLNGMIMRTGAGFGCAANTPIGRFVGNPATLRTVGLMVLPADLATTCAAVSAASFTGRYGAVYSQMSVGPNRVVGFARINFTRVATCPANATLPFTGTITRLPSAVAAANATAILSGGFPATVPPGLVGELLQKNLLRTTPRVDYGPVLVAVLAR